MKLKSKVIAAALVACAVGGGFVYASVGNPRAVVDFFHGHTHDGDDTFGARHRMAGVWIAMVAIISLCHTIAIGN